MAKTPAKKKEENALAPQMPDFMNKFKGMGAEDVDSSAIEVPRLKLLQALSPELEEDDSLRPGMFYHNIAEVDLGKELEIVPCYINQSHILFAPRGDSGGGILARSFDGKTWDAPNREFTVKLKGGATVTWNTGKDVASSGLTAWGSENPDDPSSPPAATAIINVISFLPEHPDISPVVVSFQRSSYKAGKKLVGALRISPVPSFGRLFTMTAVKVEGPEGPYLEPRVKASGLVQDPELFEVCTGVYEAFKGRNISMDDLAGDSEAGEDDEDGTDY